MEIVTSLIMMVGTPFLTIGAGACEERTLPKYNKYRNRNRVARFEPLSPSPKTNGTHHEI